MKNTDILEQICKRLLELKNGSTDTRFISAVDATYIKYNNQLEQLYREQMFQVIDYKIKNLVDKLV